MFRNYFKTAWRNLKKNRSFFALNFIGLYISLVVCVLIGLIILYETSFDKRKDNNLNIYRVVDNSSSPTGKTYSAVTPYPLASAMRAAMPDEPYITQIHFDHDNAISFGDKKFKETNIFFADSVFPRL